MVIDTIVKGTQGQTVSCSDCHGTGSHLERHGTYITDWMTMSGVRPGTAPEWSPVENFTVTNPAVDEYQLCFRCHSTYGFAGTPSSPFTDQAVEFNTANDSFHWVEGDLGAPNADTNYGNFNIGTTTVEDAKNANWTLDNLAYKMMPRYNGYTNAQLRQISMRCSDCHEFVTVNSQPQMILKVPAGSEFDRWDNTVNMQNRGGDGNTGGAWCFNCHDPSFTNSGFSSSEDELHVKKHYKSEAKCMSCHIKIPHGWKVPHLLKPRGLATSSPYQGSSSNSGIDLPLNSSNWNLGGNWGEDDCGGHQYCN